MTKLLSLSLFAAVPFAFAQLAPTPLPDSAPAAESTQLARRATSNSTFTEDVLVTAWYPGWLGGTYAPDTISWGKYNALTFAFATTTSDASVIALDSESASLLPTFVSAAKSHNVKALLSIGGWTGSQYYSSNVATADSRTTFVKAVADLATKYNLDGIDFDWEYPNHQGIGCNLISSSDSANFLSFLQELRQDPMGSTLILSSAVGLTPYAGSDGTPMADVSAFAEYLDWIAIMAYDVWGSWSTAVGPNAPLGDSCAPSQAGSAESAVNAWTAAKFPANKIALGVAAYGHSFSVANSAAVVNNQLAAYPAFSKAAQPAGEGETSTTSTTDQCGTTSGPTGVFNFEGMVSAGYLTSNGTAAPNMVYRFDDCSKTPYVYNPSTNVEISYDDATSFADKGSFINEKGLLGFAMWHVVGDYKDILVDSISDAMGIQNC
ncbi:glycoside hydrolase family 18 protein [Laccaria bicolor S238N-H82]|uniref:Glycoside hydrolase family 18 protein n=1 Tax=Laccaria bicolor (strain S238N-H82 / ATCC MYA-4686) TaxID=486041 RepID=B0DTW9_LACBS|nr:glycoside hydrolase family 18 protein [Laccaria bicolor S238N-H82]EDR01922.1 glycoside hydrolase family 18 protein [Laccaria bicolor S238N-H82]|eukprot:XP_001887313.1 glycoside hydrolase family 18 protein [Laccaria bicolor S238N-H82]